MKIGPVKGKGKKIIINFLIYSAVNTKVTEALVRQSQTKRLKQNCSCCCAAS